MATKYAVITSGTTFTVPGDFASLVSIEALGGGQAGTNGLSKTGSAGGKGGYYCEITSAVNIVAGDVLTIAIGGAGSASGGAGGDTYLEDDTSTKIIVAPGGNSATTAVGTVKYAGGGGASGVGGAGGGGGSAGATSGTGNSGSGTTGGTSPGDLADGATVIGGGGNGGATGNNGSPGNQYGGGGGGSGTVHTGGAGYQGVILFGYNLFVPLLVANETVSFELIREMNRPVMVPYH